MPRVIPGHDRLQTSSPTSPRTERPSASKTSMSVPSAGKPTETGLAGASQETERKQAPTSVPPEQLTIGMRPPPQTCSFSHAYGAGFQGSPVVTTQRRLERSASG